MDVAVRVPLWRARVAGDPDSLFSCSLQLPMRLDVQFSSPVLGPWDRVWFDGGRPSAMATECIHFVPNAAARAPSLAVLLAAQRINDATRIA